MRRLVGPKERAIRTLRSDEELLILFARTTLDSKLRKLKTKKAPRKTRSSGSNRNNTDAIRLVPLEKPSSRTKTGTPFRQ
jgi:hypothetical protein